MPYDILIDYTDGNSFNSERTTEESLGIIVTDLELAKENLLRIKAHYTNKDDSGIDSYALELITDNGTRTIQPFWMGYFATLHGAKIKSIGDDEMSFEL